MLGFKKIVLAGLAATMLASSATANTSTSGDWTIRWSDYTYNLACACNAAHILDIKHKGTSLELPKTIRSKFKLHSDVRTYEGAEYLAAILNKMRSLYKTYGEGTTIEIFVNENIDFVINTGEGIHTEYLTEEEVKTVTKHYNDEAWWGSMFNWVNNDKMTRMLQAVYDQRLMFTPKERFKEPQARHNTHKADHKPQYKLKLN